MPQHGYYLGPGDLLDPPGSEGSQQRLGLYPHRSQIVGIHCPAFLKLALDEGRVSLDGQADS